MKKVCVCLGSDRVAFRNKGENCSTSSSQECVGRRIIKVTKVEKRIVKVTKIMRRFVL
jgi:hypothetical protein